MSQDIPQPFLRFVPASGNLCSSGAVLGYHGWDCLPHLQPGNASLLSVHTGASTGWELGHD